MSCGRFNLTILQAWKTSHSWSRSIWSIIILVATNIPHLLTPLLKYKLDCKSLYTDKNFFNTLYCEITTVGFVSGRSGARFRQLLTIFTTSIKPEVDVGTLFTNGHILTLIMLQILHSDSDELFLLEAIISVSINVCDKKNEN